MTINTIIVEDEPLALQALKTKLERNCPQLNLIGAYSTGEEAVKMIHDLRPDLIFLDFDLGTMNGFEVLDRLQHIPFRVIFTTIFDNFAIDAINKYNPLSYLLKPIVEEELVNATKKALTYFENRTRNNRTHFCLTSLRTLERIPFEKIVYFKANDNCTEIHLENGSKKLVSLVLKKVMGQVPEDLFYRINRSYLINLNAVNSFVREDGKLYCVLPPKGIKTSVADARKAGLLARL